MPSRVAGVPVAPAAQVGTAAWMSNFVRHACTFETMPSARPSRASQRSSTLSATSFISAGVKALCRSGWPAGVFALATAAYCCAP